ncbi:MAG: 4-hydroxythreonine-4-phosphate dehydrogenase PdxA [Candidatus Latescibacteria bacterium]|nr:4-hydroxythreonine-4-phosphate dehydrogenase PdxA [Candidatus Latescibacterota bacterium]
MFVRKDCDLEERPLLGVTMGDACGVGPEVILKALAHKEMYEICRPFVIGHTEFLKRDMAIAKVDLDIQIIDQPQDGQFQCGVVDIWQPIDVDASKVEIAKVCPEAGRAAAEWVMAAIDLAMTNEIDGIVTAPLNKEAMNLAGYDYAGHTELLAERTGAPIAHLMLASERMNVAHVTGHIPLNEVTQRLNTDLIYNTIELMRNALVAMGRENPKLAICGVNPHAGENGIFGKEDAEVIVPAVTRAQANGWLVDGPLPGDTVFFKVYDGRYDGAVAMYHDQGHAPAKLVAFDDAVNVTLGLPIVRASVDHGTAFDIAGQGIAKVVNMLQTIRVGTQLANWRRLTLDKQ